MLNRLIDPFYRFLTISMPLLKRLFEFELNTTFTSLRFSTFFTPCFLYSVHKFFVFVFFSFFFRSLSKPIFLMCFYFLLQVDFECDESVTGADGEVVVINQGLTKKFVIPFHSSLSGNPYENTCQCTKCTDGQ